MLPMFLDCMPINEFQVARLPNRRTCGLVAGKHLNQMWGKIRPIQIRIRIREYSANSNFASECTIRRIRIRILKLKFEFGRIEFESNRTRVAKFVEYSLKIRIRLCYHTYNLLSVWAQNFDGNPFSTNLFNAVPM
jgi:hypothetical protein